MTAGDGAVKIRINSECGEKILGVWSALGVPVQAADSPCEENIPVPVQCFCVQITCIGAP